MHGSLALTQVSKDYSASLHANHLCADERKVGTRGDASKGSPRITPSFSGLRPDGTRFSPATWWRRP